MWKKIAGACTAVLVVTVTPHFAKTDETKNRWIAREITPDGPALFYAVENDIRKELWSVQCRQKMRGCKAQAPGIAVRLDEHMRPWMIAAVSPASRISLQQRNFTWDLPGLFSKPLRQDQITRLSAPNSFVVIEEYGQVIARVPTEALNEVISYLTWISGETARTIGDARLWPRDQPLSAKNMTPEVLERYEIMQRRRLDTERQQVPATKPQIEFAQRAQGGESFYSESGRAGY